MLIEYLFQNGAKLNCTDRQGRGSLHYAVLTDQSTLVVTLLKRGVKPELKDSEGKVCVCGICIYNGKVVIIHVRTGTVVSG